MSRWWSDYGDDRVRRELIERDEDVTVMAIVHHDAVIGAIQFGEEADPQYRHASLDLSLSEAAQGQGAWAPRRSAPCSTTSLATVGITASSSIPRRRTREPSAPARGWAPAPWA